MAKICKERENKRKKEREKEIKREREKKRKREKEKERKREREKERKRERERKREKKESRFSSDFPQFSFSNIDQRFSFYQKLIHSFLLLFLIDAQIFYLFVL